MTTTVVNISGGRAAFDVYIGRACFRARDPRCRVRSDFANPFYVGDPWKVTRGGRRVRDAMACRTSQEAVERFEADLRVRVAELPALREKLLALKGKRLGCWCKPDPCHGDAIVRVMEWVESGMPEAKQD